MIVNILSRNRKSPGVPDPGFHECHGARDIPNPQWFLNGSVGMDFERHFHRMSGAGTRYTNDTSPGGIHHTALDADMPKERFGTISQNRNAPNSQAWVLVEICWPGPNLFVGSQRLTAL